jgi:hypothetical protein
MITRTKNNTPSVPVTNNPNILKWFVEEHQIKCIGDKMKSLMADLRSELTESFGRQDTTITNVFRNKLWTLQYKDLVFKVYSASGKGTSIEICNFSHEDMRNRDREEDIINFLTELHEEIKTPRV